MYKKKYGKGRSLVRKLTDRSFEEYTQEVNGNNSAVYWFKRLVDENDYNFEWDKDGMIRLVRPYRKKKSALLKKRNDYHQIIIFYENDFHSFSIEASNVSFVGDGYVSEQTASSITDKEFWALSMFIQKMQDDMSEWERWMNNELT